MSKVVGIDLGTSYSCVAAIVDGKPIVIPNERGELTHASVVCIKEDGGRIVGNEAKRRMLLAAENTIYSAKRLIGRKFFSQEVKKAMAVCPYEIVEGPNDGVRLKVFGRDYSLPEISAMVLEEMKRIAEKFLKDKVTQAVITVPAYFNDGQRQATKDAGAIAGLEVLRIINEPTAAALAYGFGKGLNQKVIIYDLGGGTFDVSILDIGDDVYEVISTSGDTYLGGDDFDDRIMNFLAEQFIAAHNIDIRKSKEALQALKNIAETIKIGLSTELEVKIDKDNVYTDPSSGASYPLQVSLTRNNFITMCNDLIHKTFKVCDEALQAASLTSQQMDGVILVGGSTRMPMVRQEVEKYFFKVPLKGIDPDMVVATGAAIQAVSLVSDRQQSLLIDVTAQSLGVGMKGGLMDVLIERNTPVPVDKSRIFTTSYDSQTTVRIPIFQGEWRYVQKNEPLGELVLTHLKPAPRGETQIEVTFEIDTNGIVNVFAEDLATNQKHQITIHVSGGLSQEELETLKGEHKDWVESK